LLRQRKGEAGECNPRSSARQMSLPALNLPILVYHHLEPNCVPITPYAVFAKQFAKHLDVIRRAGFVTVSFRRLFDAMEGKALLPTRAVIITFDDGYQSFYDLALPELSRRSMTATIFIVAGEIGGVNKWDSNKNYPQRRLMNEHQIREVLAAGMEIASHGWAHRDLTACSETEQQQEIIRSRLELQSRFGVPIEAFAYPYGRFNRRHCVALKEVGYRGGVAVSCNSPNVTQHRFAIWRVYIRAADTALRVRMKISPLYLRLRAWRAQDRFISDVDCN
jgi:peptidoglycan/xylan/chitin deacetylase (PgdA/CDA1 family)